MPTSVSSKIRRLNGGYQGQTFDCALYTVAPNADGTGGTEVSGGGYARQSISFANSATQDGNDAIISNTNAPSWTPSGADYGTIVAVVIFDSEGNYDTHNSVGTPRTINDGVPVSIPAGNMVIRES